MYQVPNYNEFNKVQNNFFNKNLFENQQAIMDYHHQKRKEQRRLIRLKIITNRNLNFITVIRADSTVTDLANRALNVYLQLSNQYGSKKQLTVSAVKQGRYFMPKSQYVSSLLNQDQQVQVIIVKAKPKFPNQVIPTAQHSFAQYTKHIKKFSQTKTKLHKSLLLQQLNKERQKQRQQQQQQNSSSKSQLQRSKRERKKKKKIQKQLKNSKIKQANSQKNEENGLKYEQKKNSEHQENLKSSKKIQKKQGLNSIMSANISQSSISNHLQKQESQQFKIQSSPSLHVPITAFRKKSVDQEIQKLQLQTLKKKIKVDLPQSQSKLSQIQKQQKTKQKNSIQNMHISQNNIPITVQSPKITFHNQKLQSPKVIYLNDPIRKNSNDLKISLQKQKDKLKSPAMLAKNSPRITFSQPTYSKQLLNKINDSNGLQSKKKQTQQYRINQSVSQIQKKNNLSPMKDIQQNISLKRESPTIQNLRQKQQHQTQTSKKTQPEIIEEQSSQSQQNVKSIQKNNHSHSNHSNSSSKNNSKSDSNNSQSSQQQIRKHPSNKSSTKSKFYQIEMKMKKFKLQDSSDQE